MYTNIQNILTYGFNIQIIRCGCFRDHALDAYHGHDAHFCSIAPVRDLHRARLSVRVLRGVIWQMSITGCVWRMPKTDRTRERWSESVWHRGDKWKYTWRTPYPTGDWMSKWKRWFKIGCRILEYLTPRRSPCIRHRGAATAIYRSSACKTFWSAVMLISSYILFHFAVPPVQLIYQRRVLAKRTHFICINGHQQAEDSLLTSEECNKLTKHAKDLIKRDDRVI